MCILIRYMGFMGTFFSFFVVDIIHHYVLWLGLLMCALIRYLGLWVLFIPIFTA